MPTDPNRIPELLKIIERLWKRNPDLRLMQLLSNATIAVDKIPYFVEDDELKLALLKLEQTLYGL